MADDGSRRERRKAVLYNPEEVQDSLQAISDLEQRKRDTAVKKRLFALVETFKSGETIEDREPAAQELMRAMNDPETSPEIRRFLTERNREAKFVEWSALRKTTRDLGEMGEIAQKMVDPSAPFVPQRTLQQLIDDPTFDEGAKAFARQFQTYLPQYNTFKNNGVPTFPDGEKMGKSGAKDVILDKNDQVIMKPGGSDDPRLVGTLIRNFEPLLESMGRDSTAERLGKSVLPDDKRGQAYIVTISNPGTSPMMKDMGRYLQEKAENLDPERSRQYNPMHNRLVTPEVTPPPKKGFSLFGKKNKGSKDISDL